MTDKKHKAARVGIALSRFAMLVLLSTSFAANGQQTDQPEAPRSLPSEKIEQLNDRRNQVAIDRSAISKLEARVATADADRLPIFNARLDQAWFDLLTNIQHYAKTVSDEKNAGFIVDNYSEDAIALLARQRANAEILFARLKDRAALPASDASVSDEAAAYERLFKVLKRNTAVVAVFIDSLETARSFEVDASEDELALTAAIQEFAINLSVFLELSVNNIAEVRAGAAVLPEDTDIRARLAIAEARVRKTAQALEGLLTQMKRLDLDTSRYQQQLLTATGTITTDAFNFTVLQNLILDWSDSLVNQLAENGPTLVVRFIFFLLIIVVFRWLARIAEKLVRRGLSSNKVQVSQLLERMIISTAGSIIVVMGFLIALSQIGFSLGPLLAGLGIAGFVLGFALQDSLSNFASGLLILFYRPFDVGDLVEAGGVFGKINHMSLVNTTFLTLDNQTIILPNSLIWGGVIKNVTAQKERRVDLIFGIAYSDDIPKTEQVLQEIIESHEKVLKDPEPMVKLHELGESSVNFVVRPWVLSDDYWDVYWDITRTVKMRFDEENISIPFPQRDVHLFTQTAHADTKLESAQKSDTRPAQQTNAADVNSDEQD
ncbi:MAG: mechanosensitive ion channel family protein [Gammaproteobacteria bacterium]|nr:mechanosensitive ion channel family protein [Gammaproteobacteria bacterium]